MVIVSGICYSFHLILSNHDCFVICVFISFLEYLRDAHRVFFLLSCCYKVSSSHDLELDEEDSGSFALIPITQDAQVMCRFLWLCKYPLYYLLNFVDGVRLSIKN